MVDSKGDIYVLDSVNTRIQMFSPQGRFLGIVPTEEAFYRPRGLGIDGDDALYVADTGLNRVVKLAVTGELLGIFGTQGPGPGQLDQPSDVAVDSQGNVYVVDTLNRRIQKLDPTGAYLT